MKRFKIPETGDNVILKSKKTADYKEIKMVEVEDEFYAIELATGKSLKDNSETFIGESIPDLLGCLQDRYEIYLEDELVEVSCIDYEPK
ncbi:hypothetical protein J7S35_000677 [Lactobacillus gasseri]|uniref:hypothetical protein n=1 Tax=Lactobacillus gasseri TaxID=1596 RepID=UPI001AE96F0D|nr:hypothetical protein [Lactobacillus gasseri]QTP20217.1 hypothetical protein J7S35_000677 [Lactobacillus gasseri]